MTESGLISLLLFIHMILNISILYKLIKMDRENSWFKEFIYRFIWTYFYIKKGGKSEKSI